MQIKLEGKKLTGEKIFIVTFSDTGFILKIYEELIQIYKNK